MMCRHCNEHDLNRGDFCPKCIVRYPKLRDEGWVRACFAILYFIGFFAFSIFVMFPLLGMLEAAGGTITGAIIGVFYLLFGIITGMAIGDPNS